MNFVNDMKHKRGKWYVTLFKLVMLYVPQLE